MAELRSSWSRLVSRLGPAGLLLAGTVAAMILARPWWPERPEPQPAATPPAAVYTLAAAAPAAAPTPVAPAPSGAVASPGAAPAGAEGATADAAAASPGAAPVGAGAAGEGKVLRLEDFEWKPLLPEQPEDSVSVEAGVLSVRAVPGFERVVAACASPRPRAEGTLSLRAEWRRQGVPANDPSTTFARLIVRLTGSNGQVLPKGYFPVDRAGGDSDWVLVEKNVVPPEGAEGVLLCLEISSAVGTAQLRGLELRGARP